MQYCFSVYVENGIETQTLLNCGQDTALLKIQFQKPEGGRTTAHLQLSPRLEQILSYCGDLQIPAYNREHSLADYVNGIVQLIKDTIRNIELHHRLKSSYVSSLLSVFQGNIVEYDSSKFSKATLLCEVDEHYFLVHITIGMIHLHIFIVR